MLYNHLSGGALITQEHEAEQSSEQMESREQVQFALQHKYY